MLSSSKFIWLFVVSHIFFIYSHVDALDAKPMSANERAELREEARDMFYHAYRAYMENAYPADELMPLSCTGRFRGLTPNRGDIDDALGNFSLTLIDTLDTLVVMGDVEEFEAAIKLIINGVTFDSDIIVSVFETNIRVLGGLLSSHILAEYLQKRDGVLPWYRGELLHMAKDVGYRLLPAFNTTTGIPHARVNLKHGLNSDRLESAKETCTACAGSVILEMAALSRLTGEPIFEEKAQRAMDELWKMRHRSSDLMGTVLNVQSGDWIRRDSGVGAGIDSYYEYCLKAYILLGEDKYLDRFNRHYNAVMKYISQGPMLLDVHMHRPYTNSRNYMDALLAFWPGLQVLKGDIKPAVQTHEMLYQVMQRHKFIPEAFTIDFQVHWGNHPLRPEFLESTYFLYTATKDPYYLEVGKNVLKSLQRYARVPCGYAAVNDVRTGKQEDRMDSFVLSETFKYLYLLFTEDEDLFLNLDQFIFTTEGHLLPLKLAEYTNGSSAYFELDEENEFSRSCPTTFSLFPETLRKSLKNMVDGTCPNKTRKRRLTATEFSASNLNHLQIIKDMGINLIATNDGKVQLLHSFASARTLLDAEEGVQFMQEMIELSKKQDQQQEVVPQAVSFIQITDDGKINPVTLLAGPSHFGKNMNDDTKLTANAIVVDPLNGCTDVKTKRDDVKGRIAIMERGDCMFVEKARRVQKLGAVGAIIADNVAGSSADESPLFSMSGDGTDDVNIPTVFLYQKDNEKLMRALRGNENLEVTISKYKSESSLTAEEEANSVYEKLKMTVHKLFNMHSGIFAKKTVQVGRFVAEVGDDKIIVSFVDTDDKKPVKELHHNPQWSQIRKGLLESILNSDSYELHVPLNILHIYYQTLMGEPLEKFQAKNAAKEAEWLLTELNNEFHRDERDSLVKKWDVVKEDAIVQQKRSDELSDLSKDSLIVADDKGKIDKVFITKEQLEASENRSAKSSRKHPDEL